MFNDTMCAKLMELKGISCKVVFYFLPDTKLSRPLRTIGYDELREGYYDAVLFGVV